MDRPVMVISGTRTGIGKGMAQHFAAEGYSVAGCSRGPSGIESEHYQHSQLDIGDERQVANWIGSIRRRFGRIDVLVCNAGVVPPPSLVALTQGKVLEEVLRTNVCGAYYCCREVAKVMALRKAGSIITVSSMAVGLHEEGTSAYSASKSAIVEMTKILAKELAPLGITCNVMAPSIIMTEAVQRSLGAEVAERAVSKLTIKRHVGLAEICNVVSFFAAPDSRCITGQVLQMGLVC